ncbi:MAG: tetratricopeptide repeat protein [Polyangiaceae bacterium]
MATVTLAEIYAAQGHVAKALTLLDEVLEREPDHEAARAARERFSPVVSKVAPVMPPEPEEEVEFSAPEPESGDSGTQHRAFEPNTVVSAALSFDAGVVIGERPASSDSDEPLVGEALSTERDQPAAVDPKSTAAPTDAVDPKSTAAPTDADDPKSTAAPTDAVGWRNPNDAPGGASAAEELTRTDAHPVGHHVDVASGVAGTSDISQPTGGEREPSRRVSCVAPGVEAGATMAVGVAEGTSLAESVALELEAPIPSSRIEPGPLPNVRDGSLQSSGEEPPDVTIVDGGEPVPVRPTRGEVGLPGVGPTRGEVGAPSSGHAGACALTSAESRGRHFFGRKD